MVEEGKRKESGWRWRDEIEGRSKVERLGEWSGLGRRVYEGLVAGLQDGGGIGWRK
jgi:hypothetical protein